MVMTEWLRTEIIRSRRCRGGHLEDWHTAPWCRCSHFPSEFLDSGDGLAQQWRTIVLLS